MISRTGKNFDIILVTAEYWDDHPLSPVGMIARVLEHQGYKVGIIEKPVSERDFTRLGSPKLFFGVTAGSIDSMLNNYTPLKKERSQDYTQDNLPMPDRAIIIYCNALRRYFKGCQIVIGGIESSLRRFAHYDYWDNDLRRSILYDSRANVLVYGNGEIQITELAERASHGKELAGVSGTCVIAKEIPDNFEPLPSWQEVSDSKEKFCEMQINFSVNKNLTQEYDNNFLLQYKYPEYTSQYLDWLYSLDFKRKLHKKSQLYMARFSVVTHRGCFGNCNFCSISLHQGSQIISRSEDSIISEIEKLARHPNFQGSIDDLGGPSANMYGMDCQENCGNSCTECQRINHERLIALMRRARQVKGVKNIFVRSGIRYDMALNSKEYIRELSEHHISGCLKIAPEHVSAGVLDLMNKGNDRLDEFIDYFDSINQNTSQELRFYFMVGHPGDGEKQVKSLVKKVSKLKNIENFQLFTPTPMSVSTCIYWTGLNPCTLEPVEVVHDYNTKKKLKTMMIRAIKQT